jgi:signal peptide peptidase SppA
MKLFGIGSDKPTIAVLRLTGVIAAGAGLGRKGLSLDSLSMPIQRAFTTRGVRAVALAINSPGGSPVQSALIAERIRQWAEEKDLPVYAFCEDAAASGGYWLACAADHIYAMPGSIVGSIGVVSSSFGFQEAIGKLGVERRVHTAGDRKAMLDPFTPEKPDEVERLKSIQRELHAQFIDWVKARRASRLTAAASDDDTDDQLFTGEFWTGETGKTLGLVDELGDMRSTLRGIFGDKTRFRLMNPPKGRLARLFGGEAAALPATALAGGLGHDLADGLLSAAEERAIWGRLGL